LSDASFLNDLDDKKLIKQESLEQFVYQKFK